MKMSLSSIKTQVADGNEPDADKPKVQAGIDTDGQVFQITLPLMVTEADITVTKGKKPNSGEEYDKANVCFKFEAKGLHVGVKMDDGSTRYYKVKNNAGPYGATRYISLGFDPSVYYTRPADPIEELDADETLVGDIVTEHAPPMEAAN